MHRVSSSHSTAASSSRSKRSSSPGSRSSRSGGSASRSIRSRSGRRSSSPRGRPRRSRSPRGRRRRSRSRRRSPSPRGRRRRSRSGRRSPRRSPSPRRSSGRHSLGRHSHSPGQQSPIQHSEYSVEQNLRTAVGDDCYGVEIPERRRLSDRLDSPVGSLSDVDRNPSSLFDMSHDEDCRIRDVFVYRSGSTVSYNHLQDQLQETHGDGELLRKSSYLSNDRRQEHKHFHYDRDDTLFDNSVDPKDFLLGTQKYCKRSFSRSPSPAYLDEDFHELELTRRKREEVEVNRNFSRELPGNSYMVSELTKPVQPSEPQYLYRPEEAPAMPKKSILKKRVEYCSMQPCSTDSFSLDVENFLEQFNKNVVTESGASKELLFPVHDWKPHSGQQQNASFEQNSDNFLIQKNNCEPALEPADQQSDFLLPHERASQDGTGFSHILGMMGDAAGTQEERRHSFPDDIEDEEKFLYGNGDDSDFHVNSLCAQKLTLADGKETMKQMVTSLSFPGSSVKVDTPEESLPEYEKIHDLLKTIGLDIGVAEICKLAARTQERLHGKKQSRSPDRHLMASHKSESREGHRSRSDTRSPESSRKYSLSPPGSFPPCKDVSSVSISDSSESKTVGQDSPFGTLEQSIPPVPIIPSAPPCLPNFSPSLTPFPWYGVPQFTPFTATQLPQSYPSPTMPPPGLIAYGNYMTYAASGWPMYTQPPDPVLSGIHTFLTPAMPVDCPRPNFRAVGRGPPGIKKDKSVLVGIPSAAPNSKLRPQLSLPALRSAKERISDEKKRVSRRQKVTEEREKLKAEQETRQKQLYYLRIELNRLSRLQEEMLPKKRKEEDPLLVEVSHLKESIAKKVAELETKARAAEKKKSELDKVAQILGINVFEKSRKLSSESKESSEKNMPEDAKNKERTPSPIKS